MIKECPGIFPEQQIQKMIYAFVKSKKMSAAGMLFSFANENIKGFKSNLSEDLIIQFFCALLKTNPYQGIMICKKYHKIIAKKNKLIDKTMLELLKNNKFAILRTLKNFCKINVESEFKSVNKSTLKKYAQNRIRVNEIAVKK